MIRIKVIGTEGQLTGVASIRGRLRENVIYDELRACRMVI